MFKNSEDGNLWSRLSVDKKKKNKKIKNKTRLRDAVVPNMLNWLQQEMNKK